MKARLLSVLILLFIYGRSYSQDTDSLAGLVGHYKAAIDPSQEFNIKRDKDQLILEVPGQGQTGMVGMGKDRFRPSQVSPPVTVVFVREGSGIAGRFLWIQGSKRQKGEWNRLAPGEGAPMAAGAGAVAGTGTAGLPGSGAAGSGAAASAIYAGRYQLKGNLYKVISVREENGHLTGQVNQGPQLELAPLGAGKFKLTLRDLTIWFDFVKDKKGMVNTLMTREEGSADFVRTEMDVSIDGGFHRDLGFTREDTLRGRLTALRSCYDVSFYALDVAVDPAGHSIDGRASIRFKAVRSFDRIQVDLYANLKIDKILFADKELTYTRDHNAVFIAFPSPVQQGESGVITFFYSGKPMEPNFRTLQGGFLWYHDKEGLPWVESVCQGSGASLWWPCKDHLSDKPDSMRISITVPRGLTDISNGRLLDSVVLPDGRTCFNWYVDYPIVNYDVVVNIGHFRHITDRYIRGLDTMPLHYYCLPGNVAKAAPIFAQVKPMLALFEKDFGEYPFARDGFTLMESMYPMEHQGAITFGPVNNPPLTDNYDPAELSRTAWHETAHEWWGNSITCKDFADLWIHESFATYAEVLAYESFLGPAAAVKYLKDQHPENKEAIIGHYDVNDFHLGDMYPKGGLMLHTLRSCMDNDSLWWATLRGIQANFRHQTVTTGDIIGFINQFTGKDYTAFFDQYLRHGAIPELELVVKQENGGLLVDYRWNADVKGFDMPVKVTTLKGRFGFISPSTEWKQLRLTGMRPGDLAVDTDAFYVKVRRR